MGFGSLGGFLAWVGFPRVLLGFVLVLISTCLGCFICFRWF